jgi:hypothetical protein
VVRRLTVFVLLSLTISLCCAAAQTEETKGPQFTVLVYDDARVPPPVLERAEQQAGNIFAHSNLAVVWVHCTDPRAEDALACTRIYQPGHVALRVIPQPASSIRDGVFGVAFLAPGGVGKYADVFWQRAEDLHATSNLDLGDILGSVMAHEIGHLLLGSNSHAISGIMRAHWQSNELRQIAMGTLAFLPQQAQLIRKRAQLLETAEQSVRQSPPTTGWTKLAISVAEKKAGRSGGD